MDQSCQCDRWLISPGQGGVREHFPPPRQYYYPANHVINSTPISTCSPTHEPFHHQSIYSPLLATPAIDVSLVAVCQYGNPRQYFGSRTCIECAGSRRGLPCSLRYCTSRAIFEKHLSFAIRCSKCQINPGHISVVHGSGANNGVQHEREWRADNDNWTRRCRQYDNQSGKY